MEGMILQSTTPILDDYLLQKKFEIMIDINNKKIANELNKISNTINKLNEDICEIKKQINGKSILKTESAAIFESNKDNEKVNTKNNEQLPKPRYGDYKPEDVSINKFFYCGNKK